MASEQEKTEKLYAQAASDMAVAIDLILKWAAAHGYMVRHEDETLPIINELEMKGAFFTSIIVCLDTFFQNEGNSLGKFIEYAHQLAKIDEDATAALKARLESLRKSDAYSQVHNIRRTVVAHWIPHVQPKNDTTDITPVIAEVRAIFKECGGVEHDSKADVMAVRSTNLLFSILRGFVSFKASLERSKGKD